jgi:hypothetical protein
MPEIFEAGMVIAFGTSWPMSILKSWRSRTSKGKSLPFMLLILLNYALGITSKFIADSISYVSIFYIINFVMVAVDISLYFRNKKLDSVRDCA